MRSALLLSVLALAGCTARGVLIAEPLAAFDGREVLPLALEVEPLDEDRAREVFGLDPAPMGVAAIAVQVANRAFVAMALPPADGWALHDSNAGRRLARGIAPEQAAALVAETIRSAGGEVSTEAARALAGTLARRALGAQVVPPGGIVGGLIYLLPEGDVRLDPEGLANRFVAAPIGPVGTADPAPVAGRLRPR